MTGTDFSRPTRLEVAKEHVGHAFGSRIASRLDTFDDGTLYVTAGVLERLLAWLVDFVAYFLIAFTGFVVFVLAFRDSGTSDNVTTLTMLGLLACAPVFYGLFFGNGRALGAMLTGTRLVRVDNGGRIGAAACWAMIVRTLLFPLLIAAFIAAGAAVGSLSRISIDDAATRRLHEAGFLRLNAVEQR
ncbi:RDD family protein [Streptomyces sp. ID05-26A]|nr:RDD family protein [Streptomyces sp. ID05-26A]